MGIKIRTEKTSKKWFDHPDGGSFQVRPFPNTMVFVDDNISLWNQFDYCLVGWKGITDLEEKELSFDNDNKKELFDYNDELVAWLFEKIRFVGDRELKEIKN